MAAIRQTFFQECEEQLSELESGLLKIENGDNDSETVNAVFRAVHSIKGGAGAFRLTDLVGFAHVFETALDLLRSNAIDPNPHVCKVMLRGTDILADIVVAARDGRDVDDESRSRGLTELQGLIAGASAAPPEEDDLSDFDFTPVTISVSDLLTSVDTAGDAEPRQVFDIAFRPKPGLYAKANEAALLLRQVQDLGEAKVTCNVRDLPALTDLDPEGAYLSWSIVLETSKSKADILELFEFVDGDCDLDIRLRGEALVPEAMSLSTAQGSVAVEPVVETRDQPMDVAGPSDRANPDKAVAARETEVTAAAGPTIRVDLEKVDRLIDLVGELVINQAMLTQRVFEAGLAGASAVAMGLDELEQLSREIQESVMAIRAQPVKPVFQRMSRIVRSVAEATRKAVRLVTDGESTEVDKTLIERLADPLTHMVRNAVDHGIESPEKRLASGKSEEGVVRMSASHRSGRVIIEVSDDGAGINRPRVREIAIGKGLIPADAALTDDEIDNLIFHPGFSTSETVSDISGRGVGMDVVKRSIQSLGGRVSITSRPGRGSTFTMSLPLTLAVLDGMVVKVGEQTLVVPITAILETLRPRSEDVFAMGDGAKVMAVRSAFTPLIDVGWELGHRGEPADPLSGVAILIETEGGARNALLVDCIVGQRQVVIKSLEANFRHVPGIAAATILGDGRVALILDVDAIVAGFRTVVPPSEILASRPLLEAAR
jgi:two-component system chemotaxis sensor kinase CheA